ncbi:glycerophosphodiester phosphodiesterase family protein [Pedobacter heparinus]|uniref:glycerophosphodiester phosphodiesterase family protein n=1 Tax=Pedobacter heparinus TaxID=984 RepID=UPI002931D621|nr:glycerophosphodiester phosphodiesterase family protein [Pedobacter heparinus]
MNVKNIFSAILFTALSLGISQVSTAQKLNKVVVKNLKELQQYFTYKKDNPIIISGHRGGMMPGFPENCIESCEKTLSLMPSFFEIDPRLTKDSVIVLMHDETIDRTTNGKGKVADHTYAELQTFFLKDRDKKMTSYKIPTLMAMLKWGKDKTIFNFDNKQIPWEIYSKLLKETNYANIILSVRSLKEALFYFERNDNVMFCVGINNMDDYNAYQNSGIPWNRIMAYVGYSMEPDQQEVYKLLHNNGVMCMIAVGPTKDRAKTDQQRKKGYLEELAKKPDIVETDYPSLFLGLNLSKN